MALDENADKLGSKIELHQIRGIKIQ